MVQGVAGLAVPQLNVFIPPLLASFLVEGSISYLYYAFRLVHLPIGLIGVAGATAVFPAMAAAAQRSSADLKKTLVFALRLTLFLTIPALLGLVIFRQPIIQLLFERGAFTRGMTLATAQVVLGYSLGLCFFVANRGLVATCLILQVLWPWGGHGLLPQLGHLVGGLGLGTAVFLGVAAFLGCEEVQVLRRLFQRRST